MCLHFPLTVIAVTSSTRFLRRASRLLQLTHPPSHHVAADTPPVRAAESDSFRPALAAFARYPRRRDMGSSRTGWQVQGFRCPRWPSSGGTRTLVQREMENGRSPLV